MFIVKVKYFYYIFTAMLQYKNIATLLSVNLVLILQTEQIGQVFF